MPLIYRPPAPRRIPVLRIILMGVLIITIILIGLHIMALRKVIKISDDEDYQVNQKNWDDLSADDMAHRHFYWPFIIHFPYAPAEDTLEELDNMGVKTFLHSKPDNFAVPLGVLDEISQSPSPCIFLRHSADKLMIHSQYPVIIELVSNPGILIESYQGNDENIKDIGEYLDVVRVSSETYPVNIRIYPNNLLFIPRNWLFRIHIESPNYSDGLLEFFKYDTPFSRYL